MGYTPDKYTNFTGGAYGVDTLGCIIGLSMGFKNHVHLRPEGNVTLSKKLRVLMFRPTIVDSEALDFARKEINRRLMKNYKGGISANLQSRNFYQVKNSDAVYCFSPKKGRCSVLGGTNTALQLAISMGKPAYVFDTVSLKWFMYNDEVESLCEIDYSPKLTEKYSIVGTRDVEDYKVKDRESGLWVSRPTYLGKEVEDAVASAIHDLYAETKRGLIDDEIQA